MTEQEMEDLLWDHPETFLNEPLTKFRRQAHSSVGRSDLIFTDRSGTFLIVEIKHGKLPRGALAQLHDYYGMVKLEFPNSVVELMVVANHIPDERRLTCERDNVDPREISERKFRQVASEVGYIFRSEISATSKEVERIEGFTAPQPIPSALDSETTDESLPGTKVESQRHDEAGKPKISAREMGYKEYWEQRSSPEAMALVERFGKLLREHSINVKLTLREHRFYLTGQSRFARITPTRSDYCILRFFENMPHDALKEGRYGLAQAGIAVRELPDERFSVHLDNKTLDNGAEILVRLIGRGCSYRR